MVLANGSCRGVAKAASAGFRLAREAGVLHPNYGKAQCDAIAGIIGWALDTMSARRNEPSSRDQA